MRCLVQTTSIKSLGHRWYGRAFLPPPPPPPKLSENIFRAVNHCAQGNGELKDHEQGFIQDVLLGGGGGGGEERGGEGGRERGGEGGGGGGGERPVCDSKQIFSKLMACTPFFLGACPQDIFEK